jgi:hypothetical protein
MASPAYTGPRAGLYQGETPTAGGKAAGQSQWMKLARDAYSRSTNYFENNYRKRWEDNLRMFQSKHPRDSKYQSDNYKYRSRMFRPKTRSVIRKNEATAALAFFSNPDVTSIDPANQDSMEQVAGSVIMKELLQYRLTKTIPWFLMVVGGFQDAMTVGIVASMQHWRYRTKTEKQTVQAESPFGGTFDLEIEVPKVIEDKPWIDLIPVENIRFDPAAHWYDVVDTSPYIIIEIPMYVNDVLDRMEDDGENAWQRYSKAEILQARITDMDPLRQARNDSREDKDAITSEVNEFDVVQIRLNFIKKGDETYFYYTLKDIGTLTEPMLVSEGFLHCKDGKPPVVIGFCVIETHKAVPSSYVELGAPLQLETNEVANQRLDNVKFVLNKRQLVKRGANVDIESLLRNVPGGVTMVNNVEQDVREVNWPDVTSSSYQEQDRINVDFDELLGNFAQGSVLTNRKLNETVGGMRIMAQGANMLTEYTIRVFVETWAEPVLRQLMKMESAYETDEVVLALVAEKAKLFQRFGVSRVTDSLLTQELTLSVNVGMGATDPDTRLQRFMQALGMYNQIAREASPDLELPEIRKELFSLSSFRDSLRFFKQKVDPVVENLQKQMQQVQAEAQEFVQKQKDGLVAKQVQLLDREQDLDIEALRIKTEKELMKIREQAKGADTDMMEAQNDMSLETMRAQLDAAIKKRAADQEMRSNAAKASQQMQLSSMQAALDRRLEVLAAEQKVANEKMLAAAKATRLRSAKKGADGSWEISERSAN